MLSTLRDRHQVSTEILTLARTMIKFNFGDVTQEGHPQNEGSIGSVKEGRDLGELYARGTVCSKVAERRDRGDDAPRINFCWPVVLLPQQLRCCDADEKYEYHDSHPGCEVLHDLCESRVRGVLAAGTYSHRRCSSLRIQSPEPQLPTGSHHICHFMVGDGILPACLPKHQTDPNLIVGNP